MSRPGSATPPPPAAPTRPACATSPSPCRPATPPASSKHRKPVSDEDDLRQVAAEALGEVYFRDNGRRAHGLEVELKDLVALEFEL